MNKSDFFKETGHGNWYVHFELIGKELTVDKVIDLLNKIYDNDELWTISEGKVKEANGFTVVSFDKHKGNIDDIDRMTSMLECDRITSMLECSGYAEIPWEDDYFIVHSENGVRKNNEGFVAEWAENMPYAREDYNNDVPESDREYDAFIRITDKNSGVSFQSGRGAIGSGPLKLLTDFVDKHQNAYADEKETKYYGVEQSHYGADYRWIFDEKTLSKEAYKGGPVPDKDELEYFPIGGSNSSFSRIVKLNSDEEIKAFLTAPAPGPDYDDPELRDIGDYYLSVENDCGSCTGKFVKKFNLTYEELHQSDDIDKHFANAEKMFKFLKKINYPGLDNADLFASKFSHMRYSELCDIYEQEKEKHPEIDESMLNFEIEIKEVSTKMVSIKAASKEEALSKVQEMYKNEDIVLDYSDFTGEPEISVVNEAPVILAKENSNISNPERNDALEAISKVMSLSSPQEQKYLKEFILDPNVDIITHEQYTDLINGCDSNGKYPDWITYGLVIKLNTESPSFLCVDNSTRDAWTEDFNSLKAANLWLLKGVSLKAAKQIDKNEVSMRGKVECVKKSL